MTEKEYVALEQAANLFSKMPQNKETAKILQRLAKKYKPIKISSAKAKGLSFQREIREDLINKIGICKEDILSTPAGYQGLDIYLSPEACKFWLKAGIECKNQDERSLNFWKAWEQAETNALKNHRYPMLIIKRNGSRKLCVVEWDWFLELTDPKRR